MELQSPNGNSISLELLNYQFPDLHTDTNGFDSNWLIVRGSVVKDDQHWTFEDPSLLVEEAVSLGNWLSEVGSGRVLATSNKRNRLWPAVWFTEPNLGFSVSNTNADVITLRIHLSLEATPNAAARELGIYQYFVDLDLSPSDISSAGTNWMQDVAHFPQRSWIRPNMSEGSNF
jgi:hypothetical protein